MSDRGGQRRKGRGGGGSESRHPPSHFDGSAPAPEVAKELEGIIDSVRKTGGTVKFDFEGKEHRAHFMFPQFLLKFVREGLQVVFQLGRDRRTCDKLRLSGTDGRVVVPSIIWEKKIFALDQPLGAGMPVRVDLPLLPNGTLCSTLLLDGTVVIISEYGVIASLTTAKDHCRASFEIQGRVLSARVQGPAPCIDGLVVGRAVYAINETKSRFDLSHFTRARLLVFPMERHDEANHPTVANEPFSATELQKFFRLPFFETASRLSLCTPEGYHESRRLIHAWRRAVAGVTASCESASTPAEKFSVVAAFLRAFERFVGEALPHFFPETECEDIKLRWFQSAAQPLSSSRKTSSIFPDLPPYPKGGIDSFPIAAAATFVSLALELTPENLKEVANWLFVCLQDAELPVDFEEAIGQEKFNEFRRARKNPTRYSAKAVRFEEPLLPTKQEPRRSFWECGERSHLLLPTFQDIAALKENTLTKQSTKEYLPTMHQQGPIPYVSVDDYFLQLMKTFTASHFRQPSQQLHVAMLLSSTGDKSTRILRNDDGNTFFARQVVYQNFSLTESQIPEGFSGRIHHLRIGGPVDKGNDIPIVEVQSLVAMIFTFPLLSDAPPVLLWAVVVVSNKDENDRLDVNLLSQDDLTLELILGPICPLLTREDVDCMSWEGKLSDSRILELQIASVHRQVNLMMQGPTPHTRHVELSLMTTTVFSFCVVPILQTLRSKSPSDEASSFLQMCAMCDSALAQSRPKYLLTQDSASIVNSHEAAYQLTFGEDQRAAIMSCFSHKLCCIQGPPGCGKTFLGMHFTLAALPLMRRGNLGPLVIVTFKNKPLDDILLGIHKANNQIKITRIGKACAFTKDTRDTISESFSLFSRRSEHRPNCSFRSRRKIIKDDVKQSILRMLALYDQLRAIGNILICRFDKSLFENSSESHDQILLTMIRLVWPELISSLECDNGPKLSFGNLLFQWISGATTANEACRQARLYQQLHGEEMAAPLTETIDGVPIPRFSNPIDDPLCRDAQDISMMDLEDASSDATTDDELSAESDEEAIVHEELEDQADLLSWGRDRGQDELHLRQTEHHFSLSASVNKSRLGKKTKDISHTRAEKMLSVEELHTRVERYIETRVDAWAMPLEDRSLALQYCLLIGYQKLIDEYDVCRRDYEDAMKELRDDSEYYDVDVLRHSDVVGITITNCAMKQALLRALNPSVWLFEEAAEILEINQLACFGPATEHVVMIGDHQQLRPVIPDFFVQQSCKLEWSLMERLVSNNFPCGRLNEQRRMHPSICDTVRPCYTSLVDHPSVNGEGRDAVAFGSMFKAGRVVFWDHETPEHTRGGVCNENEILMTQILVAIMVSEGIPQTAISVLSYFLGQARKLRDALQAKGPFCFPSVRVSTVDRYQGDENDYVIVSLVRTTKPTLHMKLQNRMIVALSRARLGMFILGSASALRFHAHWCRFLTGLPPSANDSCLRLSCHRHPEGSNLTISSANLEKAIVDIAKFCGTGMSPICRQPCSHSVVECGHPCALTCHANSVPHECQAKTTLHCSAGLHQYTVPCKSSKLTTHICKEIVSVKRSGCCHSVDVFCFEIAQVRSNPDTEKNRFGLCKEFVEVPVSCGNHHPALMVPCSPDVPFDRSCHFMVSLPFAGCKYKHCRQVPCSKVDEQRPLKCTKEIQWKLDECGHEIWSACSVRPTCTASRLFTYPTCNHSRTLLCAETGNPPPCSELIEVKNHHCTMEPQHTIKTSCGAQPRCDPGTCQVLVDVPHPSCGTHTVRVGCCRRQGKLPPCSADVEKMRSCGHPVDKPLKCFDVARFDEAKLQSCKKPCLRLLACRKHTCQRLCNEPCALQCHACYVQHCQRIAESSSVKMRGTEELIAMSDAELSCIEGCPEGVAIRGSDYVETTPLGKLVPPRGEREFCAWIAKRAKEHSTISIRFNLFLRSHSVTGIPAPSVAQHGRGWYFFLSPPSGGVYFLCDVDVEGFARTSRKTTEHGRDALRQKGVHCLLDSSTNEFVVFHGKGEQDLLRFQVTARVFVERKETESNADDVVGETTIVERSLAVPSTSRNTPKKQSNNNQALWTALAQASESVLCGKWLDALDKLEADQVVKLLSLCDEKGDERALHSTLQSFALLDGGYALSNQPLDHGGSDNSDSSLVSALCLLLSQKISLVGKKKEVDEIQRAAALSALDGCVTEHDALARILDLIKEYAKQGYSGTSAEFNLELEWSHVREEFTKGLEKANAFSSTVDEQPPMQRRETHFEYFTPDMLEMAPSLKELQSLEGLQKVKQAIRDIVNQKIVHRHEVANSIGHFVFLGNPGTGKTTVAKLLAKIFFDLDIIPEAINQDDPPPPIVAGLQSYLPGARLPKIPMSSDDKETYLSRCTAFEQSGSHRTTKDTARNIIAILTEVKQKFIKDKLRNEVEKLLTRKVRKLDPEALPPAAPNFWSTTGAKLLNGGAVEFEKKMLEYRSGMIFIDETYQLDVQSGTGDGRKIMNLLLTEMEDHRDTLCIVMAGYARDMEELFKINQGLPSRIKHTLLFEDYSLEELRNILLHNVEQKKFRCDNESTVMAAAHRLSEKAGSVGFGNARACRSLVEQAIDQQGSRLAQRPRSTLSQADKKLLLKSDFLGEISFVKINKIVAEISALTGLTEVKRSILKDMKLMLQSRIMEEKGMPRPPQVFHRVFLGNPGTGKTTIAKLYAKLLFTIGACQRDDFLITTPQQLKGQYIGQTAKSVIAKLDEADGKVLFIDEAYGMNGSDPFYTEMVDTIVGNVQGTPKDRQIVFMAGYKQEMLDMFDKVNPGLKRRMQPDNAFCLADYSPQELDLVLRREVKKSKKMISRSITRAVVEKLSKMAQRKHFGNIGEVKNLIMAAERSAGQRCVEEADELTLEDFSIGSGVQIDSLKDKLSQYGDIKKWYDTFKKRLQQQAKLKGKTSRIENLNFVLEGNPGTGKTTGARLLGALLKELDILSTGELHEVSVTDLQTGFVGQAGNKCREMVTQALGGVLFIDEAYRLNDGGQAFGKAVVDELVDLVTKKEFQGKVAIVLAGYQKQMRDMLRMNPGLQSRFTNVISFENFTAEQCIEIFRGEVAERGYTIQVENVDLSDVFELAMQKIDGWANGRDIHNIVAKCEDLSACQSNDDENDLPPWDVELVKKAVELLAKSRPKQTSEREMESDKGRFPLATTASTSHVPPQPQVPMETTRPVTEQSVPEGKADPGDGTSMDDAEAEAFGIQIQDIINELHIDQETAASALESGQLLPEIEQALSSRGLNRSQIESKLKLHSQMIKRRKMTVQVGFCLVCGRIHCTFRPIRFDVEVEVI